MQLIAALIAAAFAGAQITSVSDPSAFKADRKRSEPAPAGPAPTANVPAATNQSSQPSTGTQTESKQFVAASPPANSAPGPLNLVCGGGGTANKVGIATYSGSSNASGLVGTDLVSIDGSNSGTITTQRQQDFADQVDVRLFSGDDRIRLPRTMLPPIHGGSDGWFELTNVKVTDRAITASAGINFMNHPKVHIDRLTGTISINGKAGSYTGQCAAVDPSAQRKF